MSVVMGRAAIVALGMAVLGCSKTPPTTGADGAAQETGEDEASGDGDETPPDLPAPTPDCSEPAPPVPEGPELPPGCEHVYMLECPASAPTTAPSGWIRCELDRELAVEVRRVEAIDCRYDHGFAPCPDDASGECQSNAQCGAQESCVVTSTGGSITNPDLEYCECVRPCMADSDCADDQLCLCASRFASDPISLRQVVTAGNRCIPADCRQDSDCDQPLSCRMSMDSCMSRFEAHCPTPTSECFVNSDCATEYCSWASSRWRCEPFFSCTD